MGVPSHIRSFLRHAVGVLLLAAAAAGIASPAYAGNATVAGTATATPGSPRLAGGSLAIRAPYTGDDNGNNTLLIEWGVDGVNFAAGSQTLPHAATPYSTTISGLDNSKRYQVRITWQDAGDGASPQQTLTGLRTYHTLLHNAVSTGSGTSKWGTGWGTADAGSKYGEFTCSTCHSKSVVNIKRIRSTIVSPNTGVDDFPGSAVTFGDPRDGSSHYGNDAGGHVTSSRICEVCHSKTSYHRYDTTAQTGGTGHYNQADCLACHSHGSGFMATCTGCHGSAAGNIWPDGAPGTYPDRGGSHAAHVRAIGIYLGYGDFSTAMYSDAQQKAICAFCHPDPGGNGHIVNGGGDSRPDVAGAGAFRKFTGAGDSATDTTSAAYNYATASCSTLVCHNQVATPSGGNNWSSPPAANCTTLCHPATSYANRHALHVTTKGYACTECHPSNGVNYRHADGLVQLAWTAAGSFEQSYGGGSVTYSQGAPLFYKDATWGTCASAACHNNKTSPAWSAAATSACTVCHTRATSGNNPSSGLHYGSAAPTISGKWHDDTLTATSKCTVCHSALADQPTHVDGTFQGGSGQKTEMGLFAAYTQTADNVGTCAGAGVGAGCHSGAGDNGSWARKWDSSLHYVSTGNECKGCHGGFAGTDWTFGAVANTADGSVEHNRNWDGDGNASEVPGNHKGLTSATRCNICHVHADTGYTWATHHRNGSIDMNSTMAYTEGSWNCGSSCHSSNTNHNLEDSGWPVNAVAGPALACSDCHGGSGAGALAVGAASTHVDADGSGTTYAAGTCTDCHNGHANGTTGVNDVEIPTTYGAGTLVPTLNLQYAAHGSKIQLGGAATAAYAKSTEAEICWACHDARGISEWGANNNPNTGALGYDYGDLYTDASTVPGTKTSNWTTGFWRSGKGRASGAANNPFWYKRGQIQSTHAANYGGTFTAAVSAGNSLGYNRTETRDAVANIRCTYCHDVHGTHNGVAGDPANASQPYLRGTWKGNPYPEDGAPQWGMANWTVDTPIANTFGRVPRGSAASNNSGLADVSNAGGYWIDQNSGNPNNGATADGTSGLCELCHGGGNGSWTAAEIGAIDQVTGEALWISGYNGHANVVLGGAGRGTAGSAESYARNIYTRAKRGSNAVVIGSSNKTNVDMGLATEASGNRGYSYRANNTGYFFYPRAGTTSTTAAGTNYPYSHEYFVWGGATYQAGTPGSAIAAGTVALQVANTSGKLSASGTEAANYDAQANYHTFNCGKCHNPHASRLPKLMITNCLDTNHNSWDDGYNNNTSALAAPWTSSLISQWGAAQNCHRVDSRASLSSGQATTRGPGWNKVTPWLEDSTPDTYSNTNPNP